MASKNITRGASIDSEKKIDAWLRKEIKRLKGKYIKMQTDFESGLPDRLVCFPRGWMSFLELKSTGDTPSSLQKVQHKKLRNLGYRVYVLDTMEKAKGFILFYEEYVIK